MPRRARISLAEVPHHVIQRGHNRQACFFADTDYRSYLTWLQEYAALSQCRVHAYVLMTNHVHLLLTPTTATGVGELMKRLGQRYTQYVNRVYSRSGSLWEGRFRSCLVQEDHYLLTCYRYIELNPVRAGMVEHPAQYRWSSYRANALGEACSLLAPHALYLALASDNDSRRAAYRALFDGQESQGMIEEIRAATHGGFALGNRTFQDHIASTLGRRVSPRKPGRPARRIEPRIWNSS